MTASDWCETCWSLESNATAMKLTGKSPTAAPRKIAAVALSCGSRFSVHSPSQPNVHVNPASSSGMIE